MTVSLEAKRTLVKSPPELWSEVSDAESLARHLDGLEQIKITRIEPETAVEWEAEGASGSVRLQPSGFGTKVTLSLSRELPTAQVSAAECEPASDSASEDAPVAQPEPAAEPVTAPVADAEPEPPMSEPAIAPEPDPVATEPELLEPEPFPEASTHDRLVEAPRQGFFARLFKRRPKPIVSADESIEAPDEPEPVALLEPEPEPESESEPMPIVDAEPAAAAEVVPETEQVVSPEPESALEPVQPTPTSVSDDLAALEAEMAEQDEAMLTAMLDRLGAAHHRPFSRS